MTPIKRIPIQILAQIVIVFLFIFAFVQVQAGQSLRCEAITIELGNGIRGDRTRDVRISDLKMLMSAEKISAALERMHQDILSNSESKIINWLNAYKNAFLNPNVDYKTKLKWAKQLGEQSKNIPFALSWSILKELYSPEQKQFEQATLVLLAMQGKEEYPESFQAELAMDYNSVPARMLWELAQVILNLKKITNPRLIAALRNYYLSPAAINPRLRYDWIRPKNQFDIDINERRHIDFELGTLKRRFMSLIYKKSELDKTVFFNDCRKLIFTENLKDFRSYTAFDYLLENDQFDPSLIEQINTRLNQSKNEALFALLSRNMNKLIDSANDKPDLEPLLILFFEHPNISLRSSFLKTMRDEFKFTNKDALLALEKRLPFLDGQSQLLAKKNLTENAAAIKSHSNYKVLPYPEVLRSLLEDSVEDAIGFGSTNSALREQLKEFKEQSGKLPTKEFTEQYLELIKSEGWHHPLLLTKNKSLTTIEIETLPEVTWQAGTIFEHSMADLEDYLSQRLGAHFISFAKTKKLKVLVFAGSELDFLNSKILTTEEILKIPNPYSEWDIDRYLVFDASNNPSLVFRIQANRELAVHYQSMLHQLGLLEVKTYLSISGLNKIKNEFKQAAELLNQKIGQDSEVLILGYDYLWEYVLNLRKDWKIVATDKAQVEFGSAEIHVQKITVEHTSNPQLRKVFLVAGSNRTLWGSSTVHLISGILASQNKIKDILFLGSAGSLGFSKGFAEKPYRELIPETFKRTAYPDPNDIYYVSVPHTYYLNKQTIFLINSLNFNRDYNLPFYDKIQLSNQGKINVAFCTQHGFSYSPAEQTLSWTTHAVDHLVNTIDVETNLIVQFISDYNKQFSSVKEHIQFGAAHLITDNPASREIVWDVKNSLSAIDSRKKQELRVNLLNFVLDQWNYRVVLPVSIDIQFDSKGQFFIEDWSYRNDPGFSYKNFLFGDKNGNH